MAIACLASQRIDRLIATIVSVCLSICCLSYPHHLQPHTTGGTLMHKKIKSHGIGFKDRPKYMEVPQVAAAMRMTDRSFDLPSRIPTINSVWLTLEGEH